MSKIAAEHLARHACVYVRQSTPDQVQNNLESQRRQYALVDRAKELGWEQVQVIDEDLGRSGSGYYRHGFERLLGALCDGQVGAVFCVEASRLARNGRDWHTLLEFCSVVGALLIDAEGIYDPRQTNDRLLLGMKGTISEMELTSFRQRAQAAITQKAKRGELVMRVPAGYVCTEDDRIEKTPDRRVREAIDTVFRKFREISSARGLYMWLRRHQIKLPVNRGSRNEQQVVWQDARYHTILSVLRNPIYAGAYAYGRSKSVVRIEQGRKRVFRVKHLPQEEWAVLITDHHEGYIDWSEYHSNQATIAHNANARGGMVRGAVRYGDALLTGLLRCGHCGNKLHIQYPGPRSFRYECVSHRLDGEQSCSVMFGGLKADHLVSEAILRCLRPMGIRAAVQAIENLKGASDERVRHQELALEQACYEVARAQRQYDAVDAPNRLVAAELERRWNEALEAQSRLEAQLDTLRQEQPGPLSEKDRRALLQVGEDLPRLWDHPSSPPEFRKRVARAVLKEILVTTEGQHVKFMLHWQGGNHTEFELQKVRTGQHRYVTDADTIDLIRSLARIQPDMMIASILNRMGRRTAHGQTWTATRVCSTRHHHDVSAYREGERQARGEMAVSEVADTLGISQTAVLRMIRTKQLLATQACQSAPWILQKADVERFVAKLGQKPSPSAADLNQLAIDLQ